MGEEDKMQMDIALQLMKRCLETRLTLEFLKSELDKHLDSMPLSLLSVIGGKTKIYEEI